MDRWVQDETKVDLHPADCEEEIARSRAQSIQQHFKKCLKVDLLLLYKAISKVITQWPILETQMVSED